MPTEKITKSRVDALLPPLKGQTFLRDTELKGFAVRITSGGVKSFVVEKRIDGRSKRYTLAKYPELTVEQARKEAQTHLGRIAKGEDPAADKYAHRDRITLIQVFNDYKEARRTLKSRTVYAYEWNIENCFTDWRKRDLADIRRQDIIKRHQKLATTRGETTANIAMRILSALYNFAIEQYETADGESIIARNPVETLRRNRAWYPSERRNTVIQPHQLKEWHQGVQSIVCETDPNSVLAASYFELLLFTGLRRTEAAYLEVRDIDLRRRLLTSRNTKNGKPLVLPIPSTLLARLKNLIEGKGPEEYLFSWSTRGGFISAIYRYKKQVISASGVRFTIHDLRRTFITVAESQDVSMLAIKRLVNHSSSDVTEGYVVLDVERLRDPMERISSQIERYIDEFPTSNVSRVNF